MSTSVPSGSSPRNGYVPRDSIVRTYDADHPFTFEWRDPPHVNAEDLAMGPAMSRLEKSLPFPASYFPPRVSVNACYIFDQCGMQRERMYLLSKYHRSWITKDTLRAATLGYSNITYAPRFDDNILDEAVEMTRQNFTGMLDKCIVPWSIEKVMRDGDMPKHTSPGLPYIRQQGVRTKQDAWDADKDTILAQHQQLRQGDSVDMPDCAAFARSIVSEKMTNKVRLVWAYPLSQVLLEAKYVQPLLNMMTKQKLGTMVAYGAETQRGGMKWLNWQLNSLPGHGYICLDFSSFDQTVPPWLIRTAFDIVEECFSKQEFLDISGVRKTNECTVEREWRQIRHYFINTPLRMEDGTRFRKTGGIPSGSCFTNIIDSIVNMIVTFYVIKATTRNWPSFLVVLGDDSVIATKGIVNLDKIAEAADQMFGMKVNTSKSYWTERSDNVQFLGYYNYSGFPIRSEEQLLASMLLPDSSVDEPLHLTMARFLGLTQASCGNTDWMIRLTERLYEEVRRHGKDVELEARKLYHIQKALGWLPAAGEPAEPLPSVANIRQAILPKYTCEKWIQGIDCRKK